MDAKYTILIVDDDAGFRKTLTDILKVKGYKAVAVDTGATALERLALDRPVVALIDLKLHDMSGLTLLAHIKQHSLGTECILLTGYASQVSAIEAVNVGAYGYLQKPYDVKQLLVMIHRAIEKREAELTLRHVAEQRQRLLQVAQSMLSTLAIDEVVQQTQQSLREILTYDNFGLYLLDEEAGVLRPSLIASREKLNESIREWVIPLGQGILGTVAQSRWGELVNNAHLDARSVYPDNLTVECEHVICLPLQTRTKTIGAFQVSRYTDNPFTEADFELVQLFNSYVSLAIENARLFEQTRVSEKRYRTLFEESKDAIVITTPKGEILDVNPAAMELPGCDSREELLHTDIMQYINANSEDKKKEFKKILRQQGFVKDFEFVINRRDGQRLTALATTTSVHDEEGNIVAYQAMARDITERKRAEEQLKASLQEKEVLLKEIHHRVKNNLQVVSSLLDLQSEYIEDEQYREIFKESQHRIKSMALIHERLYQSRDLAQIDFAEYVESLVNHLLRSFGARISNITLKMNIAPLLLSIETAIPCGLIINELVSNAMKHAFPNRRSGKIWVDLQAIEDRQVRLVVKDNGTGFPPGIDFRQTTSLGLTLVMTLVRQLEGAIELDDQAGTAFKITFAE